MTKRLNTIAALLAPGLLLLSMTPALALLDGENFLAPIPEGFQAGMQGSGKGMEMHSWIPENETVDTWTQEIAVQVNSGATDHDPGKFAASLGGNMRKLCPKGSARELGKGVENGYKFVIWEYACPQLGNTHKPENMWMKVIGGTDKLYNARFSVRLKLTPEIAKHALAYLSYVGVCDTRSNGHPCPKDQTPAGSAGKTPAATPPLAAPAAPSPSGAVPAPVKGPPQNTPAQPSSTAKPVVPAQPTPAQPTAPAQPETHGNVNTPAQVAPPKSTTPAAVPPAGGTKPSAQ